MTLCSGLHDAIRMGDDYGQETKEKKPKSGLAESKEKQREQEKGEK